MFQSVLVPLDGTPFSERSLPLARIVGSVPTTRLHLATVSDDSGTESYLAGVANELRGQSIEVDEAVLDGKVVEALEGYAKRVGADLIVMATHGRSGLDRLRLGSVAEGLVTRGVAPILLFHPGSESSSSPKDIERVVVALDQSAYAQTILDPLTTLGRAAGVSSYTVVYVAEGKGLGKAGWSPISSVQTRANERMAPIRERLGADGADVDIRVVMASDPSDGIIGVAKEIEADLIAMTTHGMTGVRPTLMGSVTAQVLRKWHGSLLLRRPQELPEA